MINTELIDAMYEQSKEQGPVVIWSLFDDSVVMPLETAISHFEAAGTELSRCDLEAMAEAGWFRIQACDFSESGTGVPLYVPERIELLLQCKQAGYQARELKAYASKEDWFIDEILAADDMCYFESDLDVLIQTFERLILMNIHDPGWDPQGDSNPLPAGSHVPTRDAAHAESLRNAQGHWKKLLQRCQEWKLNGIPAQWADWVDRAAFHARAQDDALRAMLLATEREPFRAGFSPFVFGRSFGTHFLEDGQLEFRMDGIDWAMSLRGALSEAEESGCDLPLIRLPEFILEGEKISTTGTLNPKEYQQAWESRGLSDYLQSWAYLNGQKRCIECSNMLPKDSRSTKRYCSETCRSAARSKRFRQNNPEAVYKTQQRYWSSLGEGAE